MTGSESESSSSRGNRNMLSSLPDPVLHHIMSFLPARLAVQMCVLSKRWKTVWTTLPVLNFGFHEVENNQLNPSVLNREERLAEFVSTILFLRKATSQLHTFTLDSGSSSFGYAEPGNVLPTSIRPWIRYAIKCNLRVLTIRFWIHETTPLPSEIFTCYSLEYISLTTIGPIDTPEIINLPSLKQLHLKYTELDQDFMSKILFGCPVLEDLHLEGGSVEFSKFTSHSLKHLKITAHCHKGSIESSEMIINSPNLLSFHFVMCSCCQERGIVLNMPSLNEACIEFVCCNDDFDDNFYVTKSNILCGLINVHRLELQGYLTEHCLEAEIANWRTFSKVTCLSVTDICLNCCEFNLLSSLLKHCPNLKKLSLGLMDCDCELWSEQIKVARFKCELLETVEVKFYEKDEKFHLVVKFLQEAIAELSNCHIIMTPA